MGSVNDEGMTKIKQFCQDIITVTDKLSEYTSKIEKVSDEKRFIVDNNIYEPINNSIKVVTDSINYINDIVVSGNEKYSSLKDAV